MSNTLVDQFIDETFPGILHASGKELPETVISDIYDGNGNKTSISIGREDAGVKITGPLNITDTLTVTNRFENNLVTYPLSRPNSLDLTVANKATPNSLEFLSFSQLLSLLGVLIADGKYVNPVLNFEDGILKSIDQNDITTQPRGIFSHSDPTTSSLFKVPKGVSSLKFIVTGGGSSGGIVSGSAGATAMGYISVKEGHTFLLNVGYGGGTLKNASGKPSIVTYNGIPIITANGGITGYGTVGATSIINNQFGNISSNLQISGGTGAISTDFWAFEESPGASSYWGSAPAYGGGSGSSANAIQGAGGAGGVIVFEW